MEWLLYLECSSVSHTQSGRAFSAILTRKQVEFVFQTVLFEHIGPLISNSIIMAVVMRDLPGTLDRTTLEDRCARLGAVLEKFKVAREVLEEWIAGLKGKPGTMTSREFIAVVGPIVEMDRESCAECEGFFKSVDVVAKMDNGVGEVRGDESGEVTEEGAARRRDERGVGS